MFEIKKTHGLPNDPSVLEYMRSISTSDFIKPDIVYVADWFDEWIANYTVQLQPTTVHCYRVHTDYHIKRVLGHIRLDELSFEDCQLFINSLLIGYGIKKPLSPKTIHNIHGTLHVALKTAMKLDLLRSNPSDGILLPKVEKYSYNPLNHNQLLSFLKRIQNHPKKMVFLFALYTGLRQSEIIGLTWDCVNFEDLSLNIYRQRQYDKDNNEYYWSLPKGGKSRTLALNRHATEILHILYSARRSSSDDYVFLTRENTPYSPAGLYDSFKKVVNSIGCQNVRFHDLRHTHAVMSLEAGMDPKTLQYNLGHYSAAFTLDVYCHCIDEMKRKGSEKLDSFFDNLFSSERSHSND